ncbi:hypothetical protein GOP47_0003861 [Adiantum capillus-veneris]|uniref:Uncharacterized protein n=1 Tax=Adiantum capillus-veneris TaxID=13818 RepID=A0A9D4ZM22_ADICA|nr:hypothetical protein GOP47_0003861 [Adiantum capillus-veneris]
MTLVPGMYFMSMILLAYNSKPVSFTAWFASFSFWRPLTSIVPCTIPRLRSSASIVGNPAETQRDYDFELMASRAAPMDLNNA